MIEFVKASSERHFKIIETLGDIIWHEHYTPIIGKDQIDYMLSKFQSKEAIAHQILDDYEYYMLQFKDENIGYLSIKKEDDNLFISKLYILKSYRGKSFGKQAMSFIENKARELNCESISLTVNKNNSDSINTYEKLGFKNLGAIIMDIGNGFVMDDYRMVKIIM